MTIIFCVIAFGVLIFCITQIILLRSRITQIYKQMATNEDRMKNTVVNDVESRNKLQVYAIRVDPYLTTKFCSIINSFESIRNILFPFSNHFTMPCSDTIKTKEVKYKAAAVLVMENSVPAAELQKHVMKNTVKYLIIDNTFYDVRFGTNLESDFKDAIIKDPKLKASVPDLSSKKLLFLYSPQLETKTSECYVNPTLFSGAQKTPERVGASSFSLAISNSDKLLYIMGYMTPK